jgi:hypothetical protein
VGSYCYLISSNYAIPSDTDTKIDDIAAYSFYANCADAACSDCLDCSCSNISLQVTFDGGLIGFSNTWAIARSAFGGSNDCDWLTASDPLPFLPKADQGNLGLSIRDAGLCGIEYYITIPVSINAGTVPIPDFWDLTTTSDLMFTTNDGVGCFVRVGFDPCSFPITFTCVYTQVDPPNATSNVTIDILGCV